ncbi:acyltransferase family protein [Microbacterium oleivorans]|nr:acyltransferase [Microbacterium oleivorans]
MPSTAVSPHRIEGLDLLRGFAIVLVLLRHSWPQVFGGAGIVGVVVFFTLSGYLITGILVSDVRQHGRVRYGRFYRNRAIRLVPALAFLLVGFVIVEGVIDLIDTRDAVWRTVVLAATYTTNIPGLEPTSRSMTHLWTLANEEQFYLVWPLLLVLGIRLRRLRAVVLGAAVVILVALAVTIVVHRDDLTFLYTLPTTWTIAMVIGAAARLAQVRLNRIITERRRPWVAGGAVAGLMVLVFIPDAKSSLIVYAVGGVLIGALTVALIWYLRTIPTVPSIAKPLLGLGVISYAAYLWNYPVTFWVRDLAPNSWPWIAPIVTIGLATVSWFLVERPFNRFKARVTHPTAKHQGLAASPSRS